MGPLQECFWFDSQWGIEHELCSLAGKTGKKNWHYVTLTQVVSFPLQMTRHLTVTWNREREKEGEKCRWDKAGSDLKARRRKCLQSTEKQLFDQPVVSELLQLWNFTTHLLFCQSNKDVIKFKLMLYIAISMRCLPFPCRILLWNIRFLVYCRMQVSQLQRNRGWYCNIFQG